MEQIICPQCKKIIDLKNILAYDNDNLKVLGIIYLIECQFCKRQFVSNMRMAKKLNKGQARKLINELKVKIDI